MDHYIITRFSINVGHGFQHDSSNLFNKDRLDIRFLMFETFCLPSVLGQTSQNFNWIILIDKDLPNKYKKRLQNLIKGHSNIFLVKYNKQINLNELKFIKDNVKNIKSNIVITTRLDDDDCLHTRFVEKLQKKFQSTDDFLYISHPKGLHWRPDKLNDKGCFSETYYESIALGLSVITNIKKYPITVFFARDHTKIIKYLKEDQLNQKSKLYKMATKCGDNIGSWDMNSKLRIVKTKNYMYLRTIHGTNDAAKLSSTRFFSNIKNQVNLGDFSLDPKKIIHANHILASKYLNEVTY